MKESATPFTKSNIPPNTEVIPSPHCSVVSWNLNGMYAYTKDKNTKGREGAKRIKENLSSLLKRYDIICLQETKLNPKEGAIGRGILGKYFAPNAVPFYSNLKAGKAGVAALVGAEVAKDHHISSVKIPKELAGYIMVLRFDPRMAAPYLSMFLIVF